MISHMIIGTSGHIDHGKTALIRHLTGIETDRLKAEQERGITIENGYAHLEIDHNMSVGFIDVPGHEKFIRTMLSGAMGMGAVILVISAEEGIKPQTIEHFSILKHLGMTQGLVVLTKCDLVDEEMLSLVVSDVRDWLKGTFLEHSPIIPYSIYDEKGKSILINEIKKMALNEQPFKEYSASRVYLDRIFTVKGFGTVVTGTLLEGKIEKNQTLMLFPGGKKCRVKGVQVYGKSVDVAHYGQRVALNISLDLNEVSKGDVLTSMTEFQPSSMLNVTLDPDQTFRHWQRMKLYHGTREILCRVALFNSDEIKTGEISTVQLRLEHPIYAKVNDTFILRTYSPMVTAGGGTIKSVNVKKGYYDEGETQEAHELLELIKRENFVFKFNHQLIDKTSYDLVTATRLFKQLIDEGEIISLSEDDYILSVTLELMRSYIEEILTIEHNLYPLRMGMPRETLKSKLQSQMGSKVIDRNAFTKCLAYYQDKGIFLIKDNLIAGLDHQVVYSPEIIKVKTLILDYIKLQNTGVVSIDDVLKLYSDKNILKEVLYHLINYEFLVKINEEMIVSKDVFDSCRGHLFDLFNHQIEISVAEFRDRIGYSRKVAVALLEYFDKIHITKRNENTRTLLKK